MVIAFARMMIIITWVAQAEICQIKAQTTPAGPCESRMNRWSDDEELRITFHNDPCLIRLFVASGCFVAMIIIMVFG